MNRIIACAALVFTVLVLGPAPAAVPPPASPRYVAALRARTAGNYKESLADCRALWRGTAAATEQERADAVSLAVDCLQELARPEEIDDELEGALQRYPESIPVRLAVSRILLDKGKVGVAGASSYRRVHIRQCGCVLNGRFLRGQWRGGAPAGCAENDRRRALVILAGLLPRITTATPAAVRTSYYSLFADGLGKDRSARGYGWRFQLLTPLDAPCGPGPDDGTISEESSYAPVDDDGNPVFYKVPSSFAAAANDGERWRWVLARLAETDPAAAAGHLHDFAFRQFDVTTLDPSCPEVRALSTLADDETCARLANGPRRFRLPPEYAYLPDLVSNRAFSAANRYEDRRQFDKAAAILARYTNDPDVPPRLHAIRDPAARVETAVDACAGVPPAFDIIHRNATNVHLVIRRIDLPRRAKDLKAFLAGKPSKIEDWRTELFSGGENYFKEPALRRYMGPVAAEWDAPVEPRPGHLDRRTTLCAPHSLPGGLYCVTAAATGGTVTSCAIFQVADLAVIQRPTSAQAMSYRPDQTVFVTDAATGRPVPGAEVEWFGWFRSSPRAVRTCALKFRTDDAGRVALSVEMLIKALSNDTTWWHITSFLTVTAPDGRIAIVPYAEDYRHGVRSDGDAAGCAFLMTDRPVYRPGDTVRFKVWAAAADYANETNSPFAGERLNIIITGPRNGPAFATNLVADAFGGVACEMPVPAAAALGTYDVVVEPYDMKGRARRFEAGFFRVEEYRKDEFAVTVDAPTNVVALGAEVRATVRATYNWGAPVRGGTARITVTRTRRDADWWPARAWDWLYGNGYAWYGYDGDWYPGWSGWGFRRPCFVWCWFWRPAPPPEEVVRTTRPLRPDGTVEVVWSTAAAKALFGDADQSYRVSAEVTDASRRVVAGEGEVTVSARPFRVFAWTDSAICRVGDTVRLYAHALTASGGPVAGRRREAELFRIDYDTNGVPRETSVRKWTDGGETAAFGPDTIWKFAATARGQYRAVARITGPDGAVEEGAQLLTVRGDGDDGRGFRFAALELVPDKAEYAPGDILRLAVNTEAADSTVYLFVRPERAPGELRVVSVTGKCATVAIPVAAGDRPNFFVEAFTVHDGRFHQEVRRVAVPPAGRVRKVAVEVDGGRTAARPGERMGLTVRVTEPDGRPAAGAAVLAVYDRAVDRVAGGANVSDIRARFWGWVRAYQPAFENSLVRSVYDRPFVPGKGDRESLIGPLGVFGPWIADDEGPVRPADSPYRRDSLLADNFSDKCDAACLAAPAAVPVARPKSARARMNEPSGDARGEAPSVHVRTRFADTAAWFPLLEAVAPGVYRAAFTLPEDVTGWRARAWTMAPGARVGEGEAAFVTVKDVICRLEAPRFLTEGDEAVLSAVVHSALKADARFEVSLAVTGAAVRVASPRCRRVTIAAGGEARVDWRVKALAPGRLVLRMAAVSDAGSDALERALPVHVHGMLRQEGFSRVIRPGDAAAAEIAFRVPSARKPGQTRLEVRWSPSLAGAMLDAIPYLLDYPYDCTEQTLDRFLPAVVARRALRDAGFDLAALAARRTNLNPQEIGTDTNRLAGWKRFPRSPVFDAAAMDQIVKTGLDRLAAMQLDGGAWGWFSGSGETPDPHMTATVVLGLVAARGAGVEVPPAMLERGVGWLAADERGRERTILARRKDRRATARDAFTAYALARAGRGSAKMRGLLYEDRDGLPFYAKALLGLAFDAAKDFPRRDMMVRNIRQFLKEDPENQSAWFELGNGGCWWWWYGDDIESQTAGLALLMTTEPRGTAAAGLVKYILNNRRAGVRWNSTRDTAYALQVLADYFVKVEGRAAAVRPVAVEVRLDGKIVKTATIGPENWFTFENAFVVEGAALADGPHALAVSRTGGGPLYVNAYLANFTLEDRIAAAGLEVKVARTVRRLAPKTVRAGAAGARGQAVMLDRGAWERTELKDGDAVRSGDLLEVTLALESKNDYEYLCFEDMKPAGCEAVDAASGYREAGGCYPYVEFRDDRVAFFLRRLPRGSAQLVYRLRAETPGVYRALPAKGAALYAPELRANSAETGLTITER